MKYHKGVKEYPTLFEKLFHMKKENLNFYGENNFCFIGALTRANVYYLHFTVSNKVYHFIWLLKGHFQNARPDNNLFFKLYVQVCPTSVWLLVL